MRSTVFTRFALFLCGAVLATGCGKNRPTFTPVGEPKTKLEMRLAKGKPFDGSELLKLPAGERVPEEPLLLDHEGYLRVVDGRMTDTVFLARSPVLTNADLIGTRVEKRPSDTNPDPAREQWEVVITFTPQGVEKFAELSRGNVGHMVAIVIDGKYIMSPRLGYEIKGNEMAVSDPNHTEAEAIAFAKQLVGQ